MVTFIILSRVTLTLTLLNFVIITKDIINANLTFDLDLALLALIILLRVTLTLNLLTFIILSKVTTINLPMTVQTFMILSRATLTSFSDWASRALVASS